MAMRWSLLGFACLAACATASFEGTPIAEWAGAYGSSEPIIREPPPGDTRRGGLSGYLGVVESVLEIRPTGPTRARIDFMLFYPRGHQCAVTGEANLEDGGLVLEADNEEGTCKVSITREKHRDGRDVLGVGVDWDASTACYIYCGANARLSASIPVASRHALPKTPVTELE